MKKTLVFVLLFCLMAGAALYAQSMFTIGEGTATNSTTGSPSPYGTYYKNFHQQYLYRASELETAGAGAGPIYSVAFNVANINNCSPMPNFTIKIKQTTQTALTTTFEVGEYTQVFYENNFVPVNGWNTHTFSTPFNWDGSSNIIVDIVTTLIPGAYTQNASVYYTATTGTNTSLRYQSDSSDASSSATGSTSVNRANARFYMTAQTITTPPNPAVLVSPSDGSTLAVLDWQLNWASGGGIPEGFKLYYGTSNPPAYIGDLGFVTSWAPEDWNYSTTYYWQVVPYNSMGDAAGCPIWSFTTTNDPEIYAADLPYLQNFDAAPGPALPPGWASYFSTTASPTIDVRTTGTPNSAPNHVYLYNAAENAGGHVALVSPPINVPLNTLRTKFFAKGGTNYVLDVGTFDGTNFTSYQTVAVPAGYAQYSVDFSGYTGTEDRIAFRHGLGGTYRTIYLDDIVFEEPAPIVPETVAVGFPLDGMTTFVDPMLSWIPNPMGEPALSYKLYLNSTGVFGPADLVYEGSASQFQTSGLSYGATYYWKVEPTNNFGSNTTGETWVFHTPTEGYLAEGFDATTFPPVGWANGSTGNWTRSTAAPLFNGPAHAYKFTSTSAVYSLSTPMLSMTEASSLNFFTRATNISQVLQVRYSEDRVTWLQVGENITYPATGIWYEQSVDLSSLAGSNYYIAFYTPTQTTSGSIYVDHVFGPMITPLIPGTVNLSAPAAGAVNQSRFPVLSWTAPTTGGVPTGYRVFLDQDEDPRTELGTTTALSFPVSTALEWNTTYYWKVVAYNAAGDGVESAIRSFTVMADPTVYEFPISWDFGTTSSDPFPPANWSRFGGLMGNPTVPSGNGSWLQDDWLNVTTTPNKAARINIYSTLTGWLLTPPLNITSDNYELVFDLGLTDYASSNSIYSDPNGPTGVDDVFAVLVGDGSTWTPAQVVRQWDNAGSPYVYNDIPHTGLTVNLPLGAAGVKYVAFYGASTVSNADNDLFVDNVVIREIPVGEPDPPTLVSPADGATELSVDGFSLAWQAALTGGNPLEYAVFMSQDLETLYSDHAWYNILGTTFNPVVDGDLTFAYDQTWYWTVMASNGDGDVLQDVPFSFTIMSDPRILSLPYSQNFDSVPTASLPQDWTGYVNSSSTLAYVRTITTYPVSAPNSVYLTNSADAAADLRLITPDILVPINTIKLSFSARGSSTGFNLLVGTVSALDGTGVFTQLADLTLTNIHQVYTVSFAGYMGADQHIAFKHGGGGTYRSIYMDDIYMEELVANDLAVTGFSGPSYGAAGNPLNFQVEVFNNGTAAQNSYTIQLHDSSRTLLASLQVSDVLAAGASATHTIGWTPAIPGTYDIYAKVVLASDVNPTNDMSVTLTVGVFSPSAFLPYVGNLETTTTINSIPFNFFYKNSIAETIYKAHELQMSSGTIQAIIYQNSFTEDLTKPVKIWMQHTAENSSAAWLPFEGYTLVFDGMVHFPIGVNAVVIPLQTPFVYTGGNLAVRTYRTFEDVYWSSSNHFFYTADANYPGRTRNMQADGTTALDPTAPSGTGTLSNNIPNTGFIVDPATPITALDTPQPFLSMSGAPNAVITWPYQEYAYCYLVYASDDPYMWDAEPIATVYTNDYMASGTQMKFYKIVAQGYNHAERDLGTVFNPAARLGIVNPSFHSSKPIPMTEDKP